MGLCWVQSETNGNIEGFDEADQAEVVGMKWSSIAVVLLFAGYIAFVMLRGPAPTPGVFDAGITLAQAEEQSAETGKPILVLATADWCPPCQSLKRGALTDSAVVEFIGQQTIAVYLEDGAHKAELSTLPLDSYPTTFLLQDGRVFASIKGNWPAAKYLQALQEALATDG